VFEVAPSLHVVELRKTGDDTLEFHKVYFRFNLYQPVQLPLILFVVIRFSMLKS